MNRLFLPACWENTLCTHHQWIHCVLIHESKKILLAFSHLIPLKVQKPKDAPCDLFFSAAPLLVAVKSMLTPWLGRLFLSVGNLTVTNVPRVLNTVKRFVDERHQTLNL
ncbi:hypothetical protein [Candidatus Williamhamiltonella defendens]|uniref:hypothetical protein n=1 Tax=Candidatus Williamhamiltonella defendens TaxID=138072 RepID=UPI001651942A|nr:hypothetical protein [Candidatus Hamiltonella defensa]